MPTIRIDREDIHFEVTSTEVNDNITVISCRIVLDYHGLEVVLQDDTIFYIIGGVYSLTAQENIGPEN